MVSMKMKVAVSNIAWDPSQLEEHLLILEQMGCKGLEISPSSIWAEPVLSNKKDRKNLLEIVKSYELDIISMHSLTYTHSEFKLFDSEKSRVKLKQYLFKLIDLADEIECPIMVFGSPQSRRIEKNDYKKCFEIAVDFFREIGEMAKSKGVIFCIEPLGPSDKCDFIMNANEAYELIQQVNSENISLHLDAKAMIDVREDYQEVFDNYGKILKHFHVGDPGLRPPGTITDEHVKIGVALKRSKYNGYVSIEMKRGFGPSKEIVRDAIGYVKKVYMRNNE